MTTPRATEIVREAVLGAPEEADPAWPWHRPGVYAVAPGVFRIPLPLPDAGLHSVNAYVLDEPDGVVVVDPGQATPDGREHLARGLEMLGRHPRQVRRCLVTHVHRDHYTRAVELRREFGPSVALGRREQRSLALIADPAHSVVGAQLELLLRCGATGLARELADADDGVPRDLYEEPDTWIGDEEVQLGSRVLRAIPTPGHTRGHLVFRDELSGLLLAGDHVLPHITPSIGFEPDVPARPLGDYLRSLALVRALPDTWLLPAHGHVTRSVHRRVDELQEHHAHRLEETVAPLLERTSTAAEVASHLRWTRRRRAFEDLGPFDRMLAVLETRSHLDVLVDRGRARRVDEDGVERYAGV
ncbi:MBL fold metallo-hydrolase [Actinomycetospora chiangmaiensis]|uniref:MBL fold metallo-hydrolase n=1 Tax=Actinomycetospora chiangmaiensis TaxID=402650 RepID=UPI00037B5ECB|nr:MBL fold metallo-hydrolase [Actinomycetospora chiangmaiensis]